MDKLQRDLYHALNERRTLRASFQLYQIGNRLGTAERTAYSTRTSEFMEGLARSPKSEKFFPVTVGQSTNPSNGLIVTVWPAVNVVQLRVSSDADQALIDAFIHEGFTDGYFNLHSMKVKENPDTVQQPLPFEVSVPSDPNDASLRLIGLIGGILVGGAGCLFPHPIFWMSALMLLLVCIRSGGLRYASLILILVSIGLIVQPYTWVCLCAASVLSFIAPYRWWWRLPMISVWALATILNDTQPLYGISLAGYAVSIILVPWMISALEKRFK